MNDNMKKFEQPEMEVVHLDDKQIVCDSAPCQETFSCRVSGDPCYCGIVVK